MEINQHFVVDPLIVVHIQLAATQKVDMSDDWNRSGGVGGCRRVLVREGEYGYQR